MEDHQVEAMPQEEFSMLGETADIRPGATKQSASIRYAAACIGALLLVAALVLIHLYPRNQDARAASNTVKINMTCSVQESDGEEHHIFTVTRAATYLIYGWLAFSEEVKEKESVDLKQTYEGNDIVIQTKLRTPLVFFFDKIKLVDSSKVSIHFTGQHTNGTFHIYEL
ncbi:uncharacterized protein ACBT44_017259 [Syngnathus typhle]